MPAGIREAFKSPFHRSNPASQFYNLSSYTRSSHSDSLRNEAFQADFNNQYYVGGVPQNNPNRLPNFSPGENYPTMHPFRDRSMPDYKRKDNDTNSSSTASLARDPNHGAGWAVPHTPSYLEPKPPQLIPQPGHQFSPQPYPQYISRPTSIPSKALECEPNATKKNDENECDTNTLIDRVLSNQKCRKMLKKLLIDDDDDISKPLPPFRKAIEGFSENIQKDNSHETIKTILIYSLGGLLILCVLDLFVKLGQILGKKA